MKKYFLFAFAGGLSVAALAQDKVDLLSKTYISRPSAVAERTLKSTMPDRSQQTSLLVKVADEEAVHQIEAAGGEVTGTYGSVLTVNMPTEKISQLEETEGILSVTVSRRRRLLNDKGRSATGMNVDAVHQGTDLANGFNGDGVVVGLFDMGVDPNHINFKNDDQTQSRVKRVWKFTSSRTGKLTENKYTTATAISNFTTDDSDETHGTHVMGTIAGSYDGGTSTTRYYGMAPHADIAVACGDATDDAILKGVQNIIEYAEAEGKPAVINLSLGTNLGHHDGTDAFNVAMDELGKRATICIAAGNEADLDIAARKTFTSTDKTLATFLMPTYYITNQYPRYQAYGAIEIIADDNKAFTLQLGLYNKSTKKVVATLDITGSSYKYFANSQASVSGTKTTDTNFTNAFSTDSYFGAAKAICPDNNRYYAIVDCDIYKNSTTTTILPFISITGNAGQTVYVYSEGYTQFSSQNVTGYTPGTNDGTINEMCCGHNTIAVGAYTTRNSAPYSGTLNDIADFSSYGKLADGRTLPHIAAPGQAIVSSMSSYYASSDNYDPTYYDKLYSTVTKSGKSYYWCHMGGTSQATPGMAGCAALWLSANPKLTPEEIREIAVSTARTDAKVSGGNASMPYQWGAGKLDAFAGIKEALSRSGVVEVANDGENGILLTEISQGNFEVFAAGAKTIRVDIYSLAGAMVNKFTTDGDTSAFSTDGLTPGIYIVRLSTDTASRSMKIAVR